MPEADLGLMMEVLRKMQSQQGMMLLEMGDLKQRMTGVEEAVVSVSALVAMVEFGIAGINKRIDRIDHRPDWIGSRVGLIDA